VNFGQSLISGICGAIGGVIPDKIEPATNPNHRKFFHSGGMLGLVYLGEKKLKQTENINPQLKKALLDLSFGYKLHLFADATTSKSLPLI